MENKDFKKSRFLAHISMKIKNRREEQKMTQAELASEVGLTRTSITNIESGKTQVQLITLFDIAVALKCRFDYFFPIEINNKDIQSIDYTVFFTDEINDKDQNYISGLIDSI